MVQKYEQKTVTEEIREASKFPLLGTEPGELTMCRDCKHYRIMKESEVPKNSYNTTSCMRVGGNKKPKITRSSGGAEKCDAFELLLNKKPDKPVPKRHGYPMYPIIG